MPNSTMSRAQVRSISINPVDDHPDKWVHHLARYEYKVEVEFSDKPVDPPGTIYPSTEAAKSDDDLEEADEDKETPEVDNNDSDSSDSDSD